MTIDVDDLHPLTTWRILLAVLIALAASVLAIILALAILAFFILSGGGRTGPTLETAVHGSDRSARASSSRSRPVSEASPGGTAQLSPAGWVRQRPAGEGAPPAGPAPGPLPDFPRLPGGAA